MKKQSATPAFVAAHEPPPRPTPTSQDAVSAKWRDNAGVWIGVVAVLVGLQWIAWIVLYSMGLAGAWYPPREAVLMWSAFAFFAGAVAFGALMMWRSALDEREKAGAFVWMEARIAELEDELAEADEHNEAVTVALNHCRQDLQERIALQQRQSANAERTFTPAVLRETETAVSPAVFCDARLLVERACRNLPFSKDKIVATHDGWTQARWREAHKLACDAGLFRVVGNRTEVLVDDLNTALAMLDIYAGVPEKSVSQPD
jgi:hypothetical protein